ncbi:uncharacterized protein RJT21DRAFT_35176 [Scheffersomyces amazonensis]|uniref:uncharacterized protein n=1 Tax=Scheffersomyces amazonensis TaxID=1078765 RepID=UPI00315DC45E
MSHQQTDHNNNNDSRSEVDEHEDHEDHDLFTETLTKIPNLSVEQLTNLEEELSQEFKFVSKNYITSRLSRINKLIERINSSIKIANANDRNWSRIYNFEVETINNIKTNTEDLILMSMKQIEEKSDILKSLDEYEEELREVVKNLQSPLAFDGTLGEINNKEDNDAISRHTNSNTNTTSSNNNGNGNGNGNDNGEHDPSHHDHSKLPFPYLFDKFFKPHKSGLKTIVNENEYQSKLLRDNSLGNSTIIWKRYYYELMQRKQAMILKTYDELNQLYNDYHNVNYNEKTSRQWKHYYRTVLNLSDTKSAVEDSFTIRQNATINEFNHKPIPASVIDTTNTSNVKDLIQSNKDTNYINLDSQYLQKNKYELTHLKRGIIQAAVDFENSQNSHQLESQIELHHPRKKVKLNEFSGLTNSEIDSDLQLLRKEINKANKGEGESEVEDIAITQGEVVDKSIGDEDQQNDSEASDNDNDKDKYEGEGEGEGEEDESDEDSEENHEPEVKVEETEEEILLKQKYKQLLGIRSTSVGSSFRIPLLPPIDKFPTISP